MSMMTTATKTAVLSGNLPCDVRNLTGERGLLDFALHAAANSALANSAMPVWRDTQAQPLSTRMMLSLLSYCYASAIYGSRDIERAVQTDRTVRYLCARQYPAWLDIRRFRRAHRHSIQDSLVATIKQVWSSFLAEGPQVTDQAEIDQEIRTLAGSRIETAIIMDRAELDL